MSYGGQALGEGRTYSGSKIFRPRSASDFGLRVQLLAAQTGNAMEVLNSSGSTVFSVNPSGSVTFAGSATVTIDQAVTGDLTVNGNTIIGNAAGDTLTVNATSTFVAASVFSSTATFNATTRFNVPTSATAHYLRGQSSAPSANSDNGVIYASPGDDGTTELWYRDAAGNTVQITDSGAINAGEVHLDDDEYFTIGNTQATPDVRLGWNTVQTVDALYLGLSDAQNVFLIAENGDRAFDFAHGAQTNPTIFIHSAAQSTTQWLSLAHDQSDALLNVGAGSLIIQQQTLTPGAGYDAVEIGPTYTTANFDFGGLLVRPTQNGANTQALTGLTLLMTKETGATTLGIMSGILINTPVITGIVTASLGIEFDDQTNAGATTSRAIMIRGTTASNGIEWGDSAIQYSGGAEDVRFMDSTNARGISMVLTAASDQTIRSTAGNLIIGVAGGSHTTLTSTDFRSTTDNFMTLGASGTAWADLFLGTGGVINFNAGDVTVTHSANLLAFAGASSGYTFDAVINSNNATSSGIILQTQTFTPGGDHSAVLINPTWTTENFSHRAINISPTQNGANTIDMIGVRVAMTKATAATTLALMAGISIAAPTFAGMTTVNVGIDIANQAGGVTSRAIRMAGTGADNAITWGGSPLLYGAGAETFTIRDTTDASGISIIVSAAADQNIQTVSTGDSAIVLQNQTFTTGATHSAVILSPTWAAENFAHTGLTLNATSNGANNQGLFGLEFALTKGTAATTLAALSYFRLLSPTVAGTVTDANGIFIQNISTAGGSTSYALQIQNQVANATITRAILIEGTGVNNAIRLGGSPNLFSSAAEIIRMSDSTNARNLSFTLTAAGAQTIGTSAGNLQFDVAGTVEAILTATNFQPNADDGNALGVSGTAWADLFLAAGGVLNWSAGRTTITEGAATSSLSVANTTFVGTAGSNLHVYQFSPAATEAGSSTHAIVSGFTLNALSLTNGVGATTISTTMYIVGAPSVGTTQYSLWIDAGSFRSDGSVFFGGAANATYFQGSTTTVVVNINQANTDFLVRSADAQWITLDAGTNQMMIGTDTLTTAAPFMIDTRTLFGGATPWVAALNVSSAAVLIEPALQEFTSGTHAIMAGVWIGNLDITADVAATTAATTVYVEGAATGGTTNYAVWVDTGPSRFDGAIIGNQGTDIASGSTIIIPTDGNTFELTGVTAVNLITTTGYQDGHTITLIANESVTINHATATSGANVTILLAGAANYAMTANDTLTLVLSSTTAGGQAWRQRGSAVI